MRMIADAIEHGVHLCDPCALSAWGTVEQRGKWWTWKWTGVGIPAMYLPKPLECVSNDAAWLALEATVRVITRDVRRIGAGG